MYTMFMRMPRWLDSMIDLFLALLLFFAVFTVFLVLPVGLLIYTTAPRECAAKAESFPDHKWGFFSDCMVLHEGRWVPLDSVKFVKVSR